jgi:NAD(P)-dependent dehydrogenase (short-subunit alcohol dehydrogenase family)
MQFVMDVNVFGPYRVTKAFAPLIIESKGRITSTGSISGVLTSGAMFGAYAMSKHAIEAYTDSLAAEMAKFDVQVSVIDPGNFKSSIMQNMHARLEKLQNNGEETLFKDEYQRLAKFTKADRSMQKEPTPVADAAVHALFSEQPKRRYMVVPNQAEADMTLRSVLRRVAMLNNDHEFSKDTSDLIKDLEQAMAQ